MGTWPLRRWAVGAGAAVVAALVLGVPTELIQTDLFTRMTPVRWWDYPIWVASALLVGLTVATYVRAGSITADPGGARSAAGASLLSLFAIGCPVCNKLVVAALGFSGALTYFAPLQPVLGIGGVVVLAYGLLTRLRRERSCRVVFP